MEQSHRISVFAPLGLSVVALVCTIIIYLVPLRATVNLIRRERRRGHVGTSLGYGDLVMSPSWRLLGPLETANGMLLFGVSTAMIFAVMLWLIQARFTDLKG
jgi:hypothetical protein